MCVYVCVWLKAFICACAILFNSICILSPAQYVEDMTCIPIDRDADLLELIESQQPSSEELPLRPSAQDIPCPNGERFGDLVWFDFVFWFWFGFVL